MYILDCIDNAKLLISGKSKYFHYNSSSDSLEILDGHFLKGIDFNFDLEFEIDFDDTVDDVCILKINELELKYDKANGQITTRKEVVGSNIIIEPFDKMSFYLKHFDGYFDEELKLVEKEKAVRVQALWTCEADKLNYPRATLSLTNLNSEDDDNLLSIEGLLIAPDSQEFQIILDGNSCDLANEFDGELLFCTMSHLGGDKFKLVKVNDKLTLYDQSEGYLGRGTNQFGRESIIYSKEIPEYLTYLEKYDDNGRYLMRCEGGESNEDDYLHVDWVRDSCGFSDFTNKRERASVLQFAIYYETNKDETSYKANPVSKL